MFLSSLILRGMNEKLVSIKVKGIYRTGDGLLPPHMAQLTPDAAAGLEAVRLEIEKLGGNFRLSDCYRSSEMQRRAYEDWKQGRKKAYSPPPGNSMHEAGRAVDLDLAALIHPPSVIRGYACLSEFDVRLVFEKHGWTFIAEAGNPHQVDVSESWHIEFRGRFQQTYNEALARTGDHKRAYGAMVKAAIQDLI